MSEDAPPSGSSTDRRSLLVVGGATVSGLASFSPLRAADARVGDGWPNGERVRTNVPSPDDLDYEDQRSVTDETGRIRFAVPAEWDDVAGDSIEENPTLMASPSLDGYTTSWDVPGIEVTLTAEPEGGPGRALEGLTDYGGDCADGGRRETHLPGYDFVSQGWYQCSSGGTTFLSMTGVPSTDTTAATVTATERSPDDESPSAPYMIVVGAQGVTGQDLGAINAAINSLRTRSRDDRAVKQEANSQRPDAGTRIEAEETVEGEIDSDDAAAVYTFDHATAGDRLSVEVTRSGGQGQLAVYVLEPGGATEFPTAIDAAVLEPYGSNAMTGEPGPVTLAGKAQVTGPGHAVAILPSPFPEGVGPYEFTFGHEPLRTERVSSGR